MIRVKIRLVGLYREIVGKPELYMEIEKEIEGNPTTIYDILSRLTEKYGKEMKDILYTPTGEVDDWNRVMINGRDIRFIEESEREIKDGDAIHIFSMSAGG